MAVFTSQVRQLAHTTLNWDTQLNADMATLEVALNTKAVVDKGQLVGNMDAVTGVGVYEAGTGTVTNLPSGAAPTGIVIVNQGTGGSSTVALQQIFAGADGVTFQRVKYGSGAWSAWVRVASDADLGSKKLIPTSVSTGAGSLETATGDITTANGSGVGPLGIFDWGKYKRFRIEWVANGFTSATFMYFRGAFGSTVDSESQYAYIRNTIEAGSPPTTTAQTASGENQIALGRFADGTGGTQSGTILLQRFNSSARLTALFDTTYSGGSGLKRTSGTGDFTPVAYPINSMDGFYIAANDGTCNIRVAVYADV